MNLFFGLKSDFIKSSLQIPKFKNKINKTCNLDLFEAAPNKDQWEFKKVLNINFEKNFYFIDFEQISNSNFFFLANEKQINNFPKNNLYAYNNFTETSPAYRANLEVNIKNGGFSSYQSEYPYIMTKKRGTILSSTSSVSNTEADQNYIVFRNILDKPIIENFSGYFVNCITKKIEKKFQLKTNYSNLIKLEKKYISPEIFFITKSYVGIPIYLSIKDKHLSFEHTHPPHEYILSKNRFEKVQNLKNEINEIIN